MITELSHTWPNLPVSVQSKYEDRVFKKIFGEMVHHMLIGYSKSKVKLSP
jgi:hypothetical protein